jgi:translation initiation factor 2B subunit (eIF-2B alpha/beta/delta family)
MLTARDKEQAARTIESAQQAVIETCVALVRAQPDMSPILNLASAAISAALTATTAEQALKLAADAAVGFIENSAANARAAALRAASMICDGASVLTLSRSSTVLAAFVEARRAGKSFSVIATESRPMLEGRILAESLASEGIGVALIADAAASLVMDHVDLILVGADRVTPYYLVNKIGTRMIALEARERNLPLYAVCDTSKFISEDYFTSEVRNERSANELWPNAPSGVAVVNPYFERVLLQYFTGIITEAGIISSLDAMWRANEKSIHRVLEVALDREFEDQ